MYVSVVGYYQNRETKETVRDGGLWMMYETDDAEAAKKDFIEVATDLLLNYPENSEFVVEVVQPLDKLPKMWKNRVVHKL